MKEVLELIKQKQLKFAVASNQVLQKWQPERLSQAECPSCNSLSRIIVSRQSKRTAIWYCHRCDHQFKAKLTEQGYSCTVPGSQQDCHGCPNFSRFMELVQQQLVDLEQCSVNQLHDLERAIE